MNYSLNEFSNHIIATLGLDGKHIRKLTLVIEAGAPPFVTIEEYVDLYKNFDVVVKVFHFSEDEETQTPQR